jgi:hypothetical protein
MAEDEIVKHSKAIYTAWKNPHTSWTHKLREIILEILIITFAISLSVWLHNWSDSLKDRKEEREFLEGLKVDLQQDIASANTTKTYYWRTFQIYQYFIKVSYGAPLSADSEGVMNHIFWIAPKMNLHYNRYEGLKGSGKFGIIENKRLLNDIINFHESVLPAVNQQISEYKEWLPRLSNYFEDRASFEDPKIGIDNEEEILRSHHMKFMLEAGFEFVKFNSLPIQDTCINKSKALLAEIDQELTKN